MTALVAACEEVLDLLDLVGGKQLTVRLVYAELRCNALADIFRVAGQHCDLRDTDLAQIGYRLSCTGLCAVGDEYVSGVSAVYRNMHHGADL